MNVITKKDSRPRKRSLATLSLGGHRNLTILIVSLLLFIAACVFFVNSFVLTSGTDDAYRSKALNDANLITFNKSLINSAQSFNDKTTNTTLPAGRTNPFSQ